MNRSPQTNPDLQKISPSAIDLPPTQPLDITAWLALDNE